ncbi:Histone-lysine N-methyltransferase-like protein 4 [Elsinoe fawcettii]|nr:Histone-lysine N-methyltransferase-like protein 4 [Elsinoe fawcettii]
MAKRVSLGRSASASSDSTMSNIFVAPSVSSADVAASPSPTPPTSIADGSAGDNASIKQEMAVSRDPSISVEPNASRRSVRARTSVESYNLATISDLQFGKQLTKVKDTRSFSGDTLVNGIEPEPEADTPRTRRRRLEGEVEKALDMEWAVGDLEDARPESSTSNKRKRRSSATLDKISKTAGKISTALGKRGRDALDSGKEALGMSSKRQGKAVASTEVEHAAKIARDIENDENAPPAKKARLLSTIAEITSSISRNPSVKKPNKKWLSQGLYAGQPTDFKGTLTDSKKRAKAAATALGSRSELMPYPMYSAGTREADFKLPYDVFAPLRKKENPKDWKKLSRNIFTQSAKEVWRVEKLERSICLCTPPAPGSDEKGCDEDCLNRLMLYECDDNNCALSAEQCTNRAFADLAKRVKNGNPFDIGVEIIKTKDCGHGLRANRPFAPDQIIIEYCGEVISTRESDRRMHEVYKEKDAYYLMTFDQGMIIDATKGNIARFVNHSCAPNCIMQKRVIHGEPRMALFAGKNGIMTGEELTYDYNFDNFSALHVMECRCGAPLCRGKLERRDAKKEMTMLKDFKRKAEEEAVAPKQVPEKQVLKKRKTAKWQKGWAYVDNEMEAIRLQEDAIEKGGVIDQKALESLKMAAVKDDVKDEIIVGRGSRTASVKAKEMIQRAGNVTSRISRTKQEKANDGEVKQKKEKRKSLLSSIGDAIKGASSITVEERIETTTVEESKTSFDASKPLLGSGESRTSTETKRSSKTMKQTTLSFTPASEKKRKSTLPKPEAIPDDVDVLEMVLNAGAAARSSISA